MQLNFLENFSSLRTCKWSEFSVFTWHHQNSNWETIDSFEFPLSWGITALKHLYLYKFSLWKNSSFGDKGCLNFEAFAYWVFEILLSKHSLSQNKYYFNLYKFLKRWIHAFGFRQPYLYSSKGHQHGVIMQSFTNLGKMFLHFYFWRHDSENRE